MTTSPSSGFVEQLDIAIGDEPQSQLVRGQRLSSRLADFYDELLPEDELETANVLDWLARLQSPTKDKNESVTQILLASELALKRCQIRSARRDISDDEFVRKSLNDLLILASGPYGAAATANRRAAEIGVWAPNLFFDLMNDHLAKSPVGFRLLRTMDRFVNVWQVHAQHPIVARHGRLHVSAKIARLLRQLGRISTEDSIEDPYPGAEWGLTLARDCLRNGEAVEEALPYLIDQCTKNKTSERERLYAVYSLAQLLPSGGRITDQSTDAIRQAWTGSRGNDSLLISQWMDILSGESTDPSTTFRSTSIYRRIEEAVHDTFADKWPADLGLIKDATGSVVLSAIVTPDGRLRRNLIESVIAAGIVCPVLEVLLNLYVGLSSPDIDRETILFLICRLSQPNEPTIELMRNVIESESNSTSLRHTALWSLGDLYRSDKDYLFGGLIEQVMNYVDNVNPSTFIEYRMWAAALHSLSIVGFQQANSNRLANSQVLNTSNIEQCLVRSSEKDGPVLHPTLSVIPRAIAKWGVAITRATASNEMYDPLGTTRDNLLAIGRFSN
jgi:hypothetical protein